MPNITKESRLSKNLKILVNCGVKVVWHTYWLWCHCTNQDIQKDISPLMAWNKNKNSVKGEKEREKRLGWILSVY